jgi:hypothetical protein
VPRPGEVVPRAPADAEFGSTAALQRLARTVPAGAGAAERPGPGRPPTEPPDPEDSDEDLNEGFDRALFAPTARPDEPLTAGMPFGDGPNWTPRPTEDDRSFLMRVAADLERDPAAASSAQLRTYIAKIRQGI